MTREKRIYADRRAYMVKAVAKRRRKLREMAIIFSGSRCALCHYHRCQQALEFHHRDASKKDFGISTKGYTRSWVKVKKEIQKCILLCANCHREVHNGIRQLPAVKRVVK